jgi:hypothetical protein
MMLVVVAAITMCLDAAGTLQTRYFCDRVGWLTGGSDTPANTFISPGLTGAGQYRRSAFAGRAMFGEVQSSFGALTLTNADGALDAWVEYGFDGRELALYVGEEGAAFPAAFTKIVTTDMLKAEVTLDRVVLTLRDPMHVLTRPIVRERFAGTGGLEGPSTLAGQPKPRCAGGTFFTPMVLVDSASQIYLVCTDSTQSSGATVYDGGVAVTLGAAYSTTADLISTPPSAGQARIYYGGPTYVRFASAPTGEPTISRLAGIGSGAVMSTLAAEAGLTLHGTYVTGPVMGAYVADSRTSYLQVFGVDARQTPKWYGLDRNGLFVIRDVDDPIGGVSVATINAHDMRAISRSAPDGLDVPIWQVTARGDKNWSRDRTLAAAAVNTARQDYINSSTASDASVLTKHPLAGELAIEINNDPGVTAAAHLALHSVDRSVWSVTVDLLPEWAVLDLGDVGTIKHHRMSLSAGKKALIVSIDLDLSARRITFGLWG